MQGNGFGTILIKKRTFPEWLTIWIAILPFLLGGFLDLLKLPSFVKYTADFAWIVVLAFMIFKRNIVLRKEWIPFLVFVLVFFIYTFVIYMFNFQSLFYYLWGLRNNFRFYVFFFALITFLTTDDIETLFKFFDFLFWVNVAVSLLQYFVLGYERDYLGGIFGIQSGVNGFAIIFFLMITCKSLLMYMSQKESALKCFSKCGVTLLIAALAELKVYYVLFLLILGMSALLTSFSWKKLVAILVCVIAAIFGSVLLTILFDFDNVLSIKYIWELATQENYSQVGTVNRLSAIPTLIKTVVSEVDDRIFGMGLGNCDTSAFAICNTPFYMKYESLRYSWFTCAFLFLETGYIGLIIYISFFVMCYILSNKVLKSRQGNPIYCRMAMIMSVICVILTFYNNSLRAEAGYMSYFILALPFITDKANNIDKNEYDLEITRAAE